MKRRQKHETIEQEYKTFLEKFYDKHGWYRHLVFFSRLARMGLYVLLGSSVILLVLNKGRLRTFENFVYEMIVTPVGRIMAVLFGILLIIYGIEKPRG